MTSAGRQNAAHDYFLEPGQRLNRFFRHDMGHLIDLVGRGKQDATIPLTRVEDLPTKPEQEAEFEDSEEQPE